VFGDSPAARQRRLGAIACRNGREETMKYILLLVPCVLAIATPLYNGIDPRLFGFPLFYWFLLLLVPVSALFILAVYKGESS